MVIERISSSEYGNIFPTHLHVFNSVAFSELNKSKCEDVYYLLMHENKTKVGIACGLTDFELKSPFSAPFGGFSYSSNDVKLKFLDNAISVFNEYSIKNNIKSISLLLPPFIYNESLISKTNYALIRNGYDRIYNEINYHFNAKDLYKYNINEIDHSTIKNLKKAYASGLIFKKVSEINDKKTAFDIIKTNRESKNRPIHVTFEQLISTSSIIDIDFFLIYLNNVAIAASVAYLVAPKIVKIIFWGDITEYSSYRPMNFNSYNIFKHYAEKGIEFIDIGISSEKGVPNYGLCDYKENIGCTASLKQFFYKKLND